MAVNKNGQYSTEYVIILGIGLAVIASFLIYVMLFYGSFSSSSAASQITSVSNSLAKEANYVASQGPGSIQTFPITIPLIESQHSFYCGNIIKLQTPTQLGISQSSGNISGMLPLSGGTYDAFAEAGNNQVLIGLKFAVSLIKQSYTVSFSGSTATLDYALSFYNLSGDLTGTSFNLTILSMGGSYITSITGSTTTGTYSGTITLSSSASAQYLVEIFPTNAGDYSSTCITT